MENKDKGFYLKVRGQEIEVTVTRIHLSMLQQSLSQLYPKNSGSTVNLSEKAKETCD